MKTIFLIGGLSESGKSTVGRYLDSKGIKRLKIVTFLKRIWEQDSGDHPDFEFWNERMEQENPKWLWQRFVGELERTLNEEQIANCCLESLYRPEFGEYLQKTIDGKVVIVYVHIPLKTRLQRQMIRQRLASIKEAEDYLLPRDEKKIKWGADRISEIANEVIDNSGTTDNLNSQVNNLITKYVDHTTPKG